MSTREAATCLISGYPHPLNRELEGLSERCLMSLPLFSFSIIITMNFVRICGHDCNMCAWRQPMDERIATLTAQIEKLQAENTFLKCLLDEVGISYSCR